MEADLHKRLLNRAGHLLRRRAYSRAELSTRLSRHATPNQIDRVLDDLEELGLLNDAEYAYNFAAHRFGRLGWGPAKVREALLRHRVASDLVESAIERCRHDPGYETMLESYLERRSLKTGWPSDRIGVHRLVQHLLRRGFPDEVVYRTLRRRLPETVWRRFEPGD